MFWLSSACNLAEKFGLNLSGGQNFWCWWTFFLIFWFSIPWSKTWMSCSIPFDGQQISLYRRIFFDFLKSSRFVSYINFNWANSASDCCSVFLVSISAIAFLILMRSSRNFCRIGRRINRIDDVFSEFYIGKSILFRLLWRFSIFVVMVDSIDRKWASLLTIRLDAIISSSSWL